MKKISLYYTDSYNGKDSHKLLLSAASLYTSLPKDSFQLSSERGKKPYFNNYPNIHFSISHSGKLWICAFGVDEVGADVQVDDGKRDRARLADRFFSSDEAEWVKNHERPNHAFCRIWSRKEAAVKMCGIGIDGRFNRFSSVSDITEIDGKRAIILDFSLPTEIAHYAAIAYCDSFEIELKRI
ncbi:MAG: 4'-phosphopantetheinyl transferase superfamily protein [Ruminococcaceae bacterium]|nr:4'-phosphopantetheinyl transferase superfamily protein [Oscillospiraceae bacterium]